MGFLHVRSVFLPGGANKFMSTNEAAVDVPASDSMPNIPAQAEPAREDHGAEEKQEMTIEDYKSVLEKVRREAAKYRTENKRLRPLAQRAKEAEEVGKSELQNAHMAQLGLEVARHESKATAPTPPTTHWLEPPALERNHQTSSSSSLTMRPRNSSRNPYRHLHSLIIGESSSR